MENIHQKRLTKGFFRSLFATTLGKMASFGQEHSEKNIHSGIEINSEEDSTLEDSLEWDRFYKAFEDRFRGSKKAIYTRFEERYKGDLECQFEQVKAGRVGSNLCIDLGCGNGEFLDLAKKVGFRTIGIDQSNINGLNDSHEYFSLDILEYLKNKKENSVSIVGLFHVIEHCPAPYMLKVFREVQRILCQRGRLFVETPSIFSLWASQRQFFLDPTHSAPVHPDYISYLMDYCKFRDHEVREFDEVVHPSRPKFSDIDCDRNLLVELKKWDKWFHGPMDIACIARK